MSNESEKQANTNQDDRAPNTNKAVKTAKCHLDRTTSADSNIS